MLSSDQGTSSSSTGSGRREEDEADEVVREIHALTPPRPPPPPPPSVQNRGRRSDSWETSSHRLSVGDSVSSENFTTMSREFNALVLAGSTIGNTGNENEGGGNNLARIGEDDDVPAEETNPLAIVPDNSRSLDPPGGSSSSANINGGITEEVSMQRVKKEEIETKISAWQTAKVAKVNNRFKREEAIINGWESEQVQKSQSTLKKVERKLEEKRARAIEKMQNEIAKAHRKAEERRASAEAKRGTKVAKIFELSNLLRAIGRAPTKRSFF